ncbi:hypothetical protein CLV24_14013 [Pontibacter ummariensis]|uniref:Uncharacterized protein n=1 Tax=Pontibacter ummariensis TaxID=1610492 RepID=A0A239LDR2_9BACT|nr:hypothetical protein [Pontibacter ummariensis]PRY03637.1 hypothetical protein CLV24_14013 [Pontibacter ummariensis]SNT28777.1 hypothetical protein SAMN06296052_14013 [Pontibacter ummariensis]
MSLINMDFVTVELDLNNCHVEVKWKGKFRFGSDEDPQPFVLL